MVLQDTIDEYYIKGAVDFIQNYCIEGDHDKSYFSMSAAQYIRPGLIEVDEVSERFKIPRGVVHRWRSGKTTPSTYTRKAIGEDFIQRLESKELDVSSIDSNYILSARDTLKEPVDFNFIANQYIREGIYSTRELADDMGIAFSTINRWREGKSVPHDCLKDKIKDMLDKRLEQLGQSI